MRLAGGSLRYSWLVPFIGLFFFVIPPPAISRSAEPIIINSDWIITDVQTVDNQRIVLNSRIIVRAPGQLILNNSVIEINEELLPNADDCQLKAAIRIEPGSLGVRISGSTLTSVNQKPVALRIANTSNCSLTNSFWNGVAVEAYCCDGFTITGNTFNFTSLFAFNAILIGQSRETSISNNVFQIKTDYSVSSPRPLNAVLLLNSDDAVITNNQMAGFASGITLTSSSGAISWPVT